MTLTLWNGPGKASQALAAWLTSALSNVAVSCLLWGCTNQQTGAPSWNSIICRSTVTSLSYMLFSSFLICHPCFICFHCKLVETKVGIISFIQDRDTFILTSFLSFPFYVTSFFRKKQRKKRLSLEPLDRSLGAGRGTCAVIIKFRGDNSGGLRFFNQFESLSDM